MKKRIIGIAVAFGLSLFAAAASAQSIGGNASLSASTAPTIAPPGEHADLSFCFDRSDGNVYAGSLLQAWRL